MNCQHHALTIGSKSQSHFYVVTSKEALKMDRCDCCQESFEKMSKYALQNLVQFCLSLSSSVEWYATNSTEGRDATQRGPRQTWNMDSQELHEAQQVQAWPRLRQSQISRLGELMESSPAERDLGLWQGDRWMCPGPEIPCVLGWSLSIEEVGILPCSGKTSVCDVSSSMVLNTINKLTS